MLEDEIISEKKTENIYQLCSHKGGNFNLVIFEQHIKHTYDLDKIEASTIPFEAPQLGHAAGKHSLELMRDNMGSQGKNNEARTLWVVQRLHARVVVLCFFRFLSQ